MHRTQRKGLIVKHFKVFAVATLFFVTIMPTQAQNPYSRSFPLKIGDIDVGELVISFEDVLEVGDFSISLRQTLDDGTQSVSELLGGITGLTSSLLPAGVVPLNLPLLNSPLVVTVETTTSFRGPAHVTLRLFLLEYDKRIPFRLFCTTNSLLSPFRDITASTGKGSMYTSGYRKGFSEFLVALDLRRLNTVIGIKFEELNDALDSGAPDISPDTLADLGDYLWQAERSWSRGNAARALDLITRFSDAVKQGAAQGQIPNTHNDPSNPAGNVAGELFAGAQTLMFSLRLAQ